MQSICQIARLLPSVTIGKLLLPIISSRKQKTVSSLSIFAIATYHTFIPFSTYLVVSDSTAAASTNKEEAGNDEFDDINNKSEESIDKEV